ncbi:amino acid adenylation domain-containing protein [Micromonospora sp. NPDC050980]|uniref:non-ribosomal peptide synthetase n=1 Tax=Micromonospora sp. NPDC050980 TaxID=3155161 RepID=UPI0033F09C62
MTVTSSRPASRTRDWVRDELWLQHRLTGGASTPHECRALRIDGPLDVTALRRAWRQVCRRHPALRTSVEERHELPAVVVTGEGAPVRSVDVSADPQPERRADEVCREIAGAPFRLAEVPLARLLVVRIAPTRHRLMLVTHRAVADGAGPDRVLADLIRAYPAAARPAPSATVGPAGAGPGWPVPDAGPAPVDGPPFAPPDDRAEPMRWWREALAGCPATLTLPADHPRPGGPCWRAGVVRFDWGAGPAAAVARLADATGTTGGVVLLAAVHALVHRWTGADRVTVGYPVDTPPLEVGPYRNLLAVPVDLTRSPRFETQVRRTAATLRRARAYGGVPLRDLARECGVPPLPGRLPWCDVLVVPPSTVTAPARPGWHAVPPPFTGTARTDLTFVLDRVAGTVAGSLEYRADLFTPETARLLVDQLHTLLDAALARPRVPVSALPVDPPRSAPHRPPQVVAPGRTVTEAVHRLAVRQPWNPAVRWQGRSVSYRELDAWAAAVAGRLDAAAGTAVAVRVPTGPGRVAALLGVLRSGAHLLWSSAGDGGQRGRAVLADVRPRWLLTGTDQADPQADWYARTHDGQLLAVDRPAGEHPPAGPPPPGAPTALAYVAHTSGSTGRPKGVPQTHAALLQFASWFAATFDCRPGVRVAQWVAPEHDPAICEVFAALVGGATLCPVPDATRAHPERLVRWLAEERVDVWQTVPSFAREAARAMRALGVRPPLRHLVLMGEAVPDELVEELRELLPDTALSNLYGPTETVAATCHRIDGAGGGRTPIGRAIPGRRVLVLDERDRLCPAGVTGELVVVSPYVTPGYLGDVPDGGAFRPAPYPVDDGERWYRTGDLARRRADGVLEFRGRRDHQVKLQGHRLELTEIEAALAADDTVAECAVLPVRDRAGLVVRLVAYVRPVAGAGQPGRWRERLRARFGGLLLPVTFRAVRAPLPRTVVGKVDRARLDATAAVDAVERSGWAAAEAAVVEVWADLIGATGLTPTDDFFDRGGDPVLLPALAARLARRRGVDVHASDCWAAPTVAGQVALVLRAGADRP